MAPRPPAAALLGLGLAALLWRPSGLGFALSGRPLGPPRLQLGTAGLQAHLPWPAPHGLPAAAAAGTPDEEQSPGLGSFGGEFGWPLAGLALAAAAVAGGRGSRTRMQGRFSGRYKFVHGGEGPPRTPKYLSVDEKERKKWKPTVPNWLSLKKWESFKASDRARSLRWYVITHDENGAPRVDKKKAYSIKDAVDIMLSMQTAEPLKFDPTLEVHMQMNLDPKYPDQQIRCSVTLPHGTGKKVRVAVFCTEDDEDEVRELGADISGKQLAQEITEEKINFDVLIAKPQMMPKLAKLGKILGPRRLMPSPKSGTVITDYAEAIKSFKFGSTVELRNDRNALVQCACGKLSFGSEKLVENFRAVLTGLMEKRPLGAKPDFWKQVHMGSTMSPSILIAPNEFPTFELKSSD
mmetsp:Transcript_43495/g.138491  ORF Transcript_43495/g.138491 Transcript_43495/m.138491 type:complete len:407 (-) Transcript_43495:111-1331(-)